MRLKVDRLVVPPLRERGGDVLLLARHFLDARRARPASERPRLARGGRGGARGVRWPGNVRELQNEMQRLVVRAPGTASSSPTSSRRDRPAPSPGGTLKAALQRAESEILLSMLEKHEGRQARAAAELGITRQALWAKLRRLGVWPSEPL